MSPAAGGALTTRESYSASAAAGAQRYDAALSEIASHPSLARLAGKSIGVVGCGGMIGSAIGSVLRRVPERAEPGSLNAVGVARHRGGWPDDLPFIAADVRDRQAALPAIDYCIYLAGPSGDYQSAPEAMIDVHLSGLISAFTRCGSARFVYVSSTRVYGRRTPPPHREDQPVDVESLSLDELYDAAKRWAESYCVWEVKRRARHVSIVRLSNAYGPHGSNGHVVASLTSEIWRGRRVTLTGAEQSRRDYCAAADAAGGVLLALAEGSAGRVYNIGGDDVWATIDLARHLGSLAPFAVDIKAAEGQATSSWPDLSRARTELQYRPCLTLKAIGAATLAWTEPR